MKSLYFTDEHDIFRESIRRFIQQEVIPNAPEWEKNQQTPKEIFRKMGDLGLLGINYSSEYGGNNADFFYSVVFLEELGRCGFGGFSAAVSVSQYMATAHLANIGTQDQKERFLKPSISGEKVGALAITEPSTGSDVRAIRATALKDGNQYVVNGRKMFVTNGLHADFITLAAKTKPKSGSGGISLFLIESGTPGLIVNPLNNMGWHSTDTCELVFEDVRVSEENRIGVENKGFYYIMESFQLERLVTAILAIGQCRRCLEITLPYLGEREVFRKPLAKFQTIRHTMADLASELESVTQFVYHTSWLFSEGEVPVKECSMVKMLATELAKKISDECLQLFGGYGYMVEYEIERLFRDLRVGTIVGGASAIMREIISKTVFDDVTYKKVY